MQKRWKNFIDFEKLGLIFVMLVFSLNTNLALQISLFTISAFILVCEFELNNPRCWFVFVYYIYSVSYPVLYILGLLGKDYGCSDYLVPLQFFGMFFFVLGTYFPTPRIRVRIKHSLTKNTKYPLGTLRIVIITGISILFLGLIMILRGEFTNKTNLYDTANFYILFVLKYVHLQIFFTCFYWIKNGKIDKTIFLSLLSVILLGFASGERDLIFRVIIISGLRLFISGEISKKAIFVLVPFVLLLFPILTSLKYVSMGRSADFSFLGDVNSLIVAFFNSDFISASSNLQIMLNNLSLFEYNWLSFFQTLSRIFYSGSYVSPQIYYNDVVLQTTSTKYGFTLVGEGYLYGRIAGVALMMLFVGYLAKSFYVKSFNSEIAQTTYLFMVPLFMYSIRGEVIAILSPLFKYVLVGYILLYFLQFVNDIRFKVKVKYN